MYYINSPVAQLADAPLLKGDCYEFESHPGHQITLKVVGSLLTSN